MKRKILVSITSRASFARFESAIREIQKNKNLELLLAISSSFLSNKYSSFEKINKKMKLNNIYKIQNLFEEDNISAAAKTTGLLTLELATLIDNYNPDIVVTIADRYETIANAIASSFSNITLVHIQGGEVTGNIDEKVRHSITKLSDYHFVSNTDAYKRIIKLGENKNRIYNVGCPSIDIAKEVLRDKKNLNLNFLKNYSQGVGFEINLKKEYFVVLMHPETENKNKKNNISIIFDCLIKLNKQAFILWPNADPGTNKISEQIRSYREKNNNLPFKFLKNILPKDFLRLLIFSKCLIGNSSVGIRECSYLGVPVINLGVRQNRRIRGKNVIDIKFNKDQILNSLKKQSKISKYKSEKIYGNGSSGKKISNLLTKIKLIHSKTISY